MLITPAGQMGPSTAEQAARAFTGRAAPVVAGLLGGRGHQEWNGQVTLFSTAEHPDWYADIDWDGHIEYQRELMEHLAADACRDGPVTDYQPYVVALHELIHGTIGGYADDPARRRAWEKLPGRDRDVLSQMHRLDTIGPTGEPYMHNLDDLRGVGRGVGGPAQLSRLEKAGLVRKSSYTTETRAGMVHSWMLTGKAAAMMPRDMPERYQDHSDAYQNGTVQAIEEGTTELGAINHLPEFVNAMGVGGRPTGVVYTGHGNPLINPEYETRLDTLALHLAALRNDLLAAGQAEERPGRPAPAARPVRAERRPRRRPARAGRRRRRRPGPGQRLPGQDAAGRVRRAARHPHVRAPDVRPVRQAAARPQADRGRRRLGPLRVADRRCPSLGASRRPGRRPRHPGPGPRRHR